MKNEAASLMDNEEFTVGNDAHIAPMTGFGFWNDVGIVPYGLKLI